MKTIILIFALFLSAQVASAQSIIFKNACPDLAPGDVYRPGMNAEEYLALSERWSCLNATQASQSPEVKRKVRVAFRNVGIKEGPAICSIDPRIGPRGCSLDLYDGDCVWTFGAWKSKTPGCGIDFADEPGCPNARWKLERELRRQVRNKR